MPARALTLHLLRMLETRMDAAGIALQAEIQSFTVAPAAPAAGGRGVFLRDLGRHRAAGHRLAAAPAHSGPVRGGRRVRDRGVWAQSRRETQGASHDVGSMSWFLDSLKQDVEVLSRSLAQSQRSKRARRPSRRRRQRMNPPERSQ